MENITCKDLSKLRVVDLKEIAKSKGLHGYSKLRKAELINLLRQSERPKRKIIFVVQPEQPEQPTGSPLDEPEQRERPKRKIIFVVQPEQPEQPTGSPLDEPEQPEQPTGSPLDEPEQPEQPTGSPLDEPEVDLIDLHSPEDEILKGIFVEEPEQLAGSLLDESIPEDEILKEHRQAGILMPTKAKKIEKAVEWGKKEVENWGEWLKEMDAAEATRPLVDDALEAFKSHIAELYKMRPFQARFELVESKSALKKFTRQYKIEGLEGYGPESFLSAVKPTLVKFLRENPNTKIKLVLKCIMSKTDLKTGEVIFTPAYFTSNVEINFQGTDVSELYKAMTDKMLESLAAYQQRGSNWVFDSVEELALHTVKYVPLSGSSYIKLPKALADKKAIINMKNEDNECFKWCVTRALNPVKKNAERISEILQLQAKKLNWEGLKFPMELKNINRFEKLNEVSVNVFGYEKYEIYPLIVSNHSNMYSHHVNLLLISQGEKKHYCLIKSMSRLLSEQTSTKEHKKLYCLRCLNSFGRQNLLDKHLELCRDSEAVRTKMPKKGECVHFKNHHKKMDMPFVIYADFESVMKPFGSVQPNPKQSYTEKKMVHIPVSFCYYVKCSFDDNFSKVVEYTATSEDEDIAQIFVNKLEQEVKSIYSDHPPKKMIFTTLDDANYKKSTNCWICNGAFTEEDYKVRDHCHYTGKFRGAAHNSCNIKFRRPKFTPVIFHNLAGYDTHLFIKNLGVSEGNIDCIPNNEEKYISFTKHVEVDRFLIPQDDKEVIVTRELRFIDSMKFMNSSLDKLVKNLGENGFKNAEKYFDGEQLRLLKRKGVYPYEWLDSVGRLNETQLPNKNAFFSKLSGQGISDEDYKHAHNVWDTFAMKSMKDYHNLYNKTDVILLADVFENFRKLCKKNYDLDPCWYYTAPGLAWDACLKCTDIKLELLTDPDMLLMFEKGTRGGISTISTRHGQANNKYMGEKFDVNKLSKYITYLDANNLYGYAMCKKLPTGGFKWMTEEELNGWKNHPCILEVDLEYSKELHDLHNEYPLAPERLLINKVEKLIPNLNDKKKYIIHYENLKQYEKLGMKITHIHRGIKFEESDWMKKYIDLNTNLRAKAKNEFEKDFFKLMNNSVYGKTIENLRKRVDISLVNSEKTAKRLTSKPNFKNCTIFSENLCAIEMKKTQVYFNKPVYLGMCILELSKILMYDFHYNYIKPKYNDKAKLLFTDTDSLAYEIQTEDFYRDISSDVEAKFDTSNFPKDHPSGIPTGANKKVVGMFKDEAGGKIIEEFVGLRAKLYSYKMFDSEKEEKKCKGVKKGVVEKTITFDDYKKCLFSGERQYRKMMAFRSRKHEMFTEEINKIALSADDDKRIILPDNINTLAYGHCLDRHNS